MKCIASEDLKLLLDRSPDMLLFEDWFIEGGRWVKTKENEKMKKLREEMMD